MEFVKDKIRIIHGDCMELMINTPDKYYDLAICDPPYGIGAGAKTFINGTSKSIKKYYKDNDWDKSTPPNEYFTELKRVSKNQIVWGGNYFAEYLGNFRCFICWDKTIHGNSYADCELAWTSFDNVARYYRENIAQTNVEGRIHPTQKSVKLYRWVLNQYATTDMHILDTHLGSGSSAIAAHFFGCSFTGIEIDEDYYNASVKRFKLVTSQQQLF